MTLETGSRIQDLVATNPVGATDFVSQGDDHIRLLKACIKGSFPNLGANQVTADADELSILDGATLTVAELNILDGVTATAAELNKLAGTPAGLTSTELGYMDGVTSSVQTQLDAKASTAAVAAGFQPLDADLTAIAALTTTTFGRGFLDLADLAALATKINALVPTWTGLHTFAVSAGYPTIHVKAPANGYSAISLEDASGTRQLELLYATAGAAGAYGIAAGQSGLNAQNGALVLSTADVAALKIDSSQVVSINDAGTMRQAGFKVLPYRTISSSDNTAATDSAHGVYYTGTGGHTFTLDSDPPTLSLVTIFNAGSAALTIAASGSLSWFNGAGSVVVGSRTLAIGGIATAWHGSGSGGWQIWGNGLS